MHAALASTGKFPSSGQVHPFPQSHHLRTSDVSDNTVPPTTHVWAKFFLAQLYDFVGESEAALAILDEAIKHTPTYPELYTCKAKIYKVPILM